MATAITVQYTTSPTLATSSGIWPAIVAAIAGTLNLLVWFPGKANNDCDSQYHQIQSGILNDWHPPAMTRLWQLLLHLGPGTAPLFTVNILLYWAAPGLISVALARSGRRIAAWAVLAVFAIPTFIMQDVNITKDVHLAVVVLTAFALVFAFRSRGLDVPGWARAVVIVLVAYAMLVRINAVFVVVPVLAYAAPWRSWLRAPVPLAVLTVLVGVALVPVTTAINHRILLAHDAGAIRSLQLFDLSGIAERSGDVAVFGAASTLGRAEIGRCYSPMMWDTLREDGRCPDLVARIGRQREDAFVRLPPLADLWTAAIVHHPGAYAGHRFANFNSATFFAEPIHHLDAVRTFATASGRAPSLANRALDWVRYFPPLMPGVLLALGVGLAVLLVADRTMRERAEPFGIVALLLAGLAYGFSFLVVGVATDLRYFLFSDLAILTAAVLTMSALSGTDARRRVSWPVMACAAVPLVALLVTVTARLMLPAPIPHRAEAAAGAPANTPTDRSDPGHG